LLVRDGLGWAGPIMAGPLLRVTDLRAGYGESVALDGVSLEVPEGGSVAWRGASVELLADHASLDRFIGLNLAEGGAEAR
jgi:hypothetical protein